MRQRNIVLSSEGARHPFRRTLPQHVTTLTEPLRAAPSSDSDWKLFLLSFVAFFTAFYSFIF
jgi:hypothetical protein